MKRPIIVLMAMSAALFALPTGCNKNPTPEANAPLPPPTPATVVARLTQPDSAAILPHKIESATAFPQALSSLAPDVTAPQVAPPTAESPAVDPNGPPSKGLTADGVTVDLVMHDWTGIVLVPLDTSISRANTVSVALDRIEAHPLENGQVRIWARVHNVTHSALSCEVACSFSTAETPEPERPIFYKLDIPKDASRDVFFVSPEGRNLNSYTVLVRTGDTTVTGSGSMPQKP